MGVHTRAVSATKRRDRRQVLQVGEQGPGAPRLLTRLSLCRPCHSRAALDGGLLSADKPGSQWTRPWVRTSRSRGSNGCWPRPGCCHRDTTEQEYEQSVNTERLPSYWISRELPLLGTTLHPNPCQTQWGCVGGASVKAGRFHFRNSRS